MPTTSPATPVVFTLASRLAAHVVLAVAGTAARIISTRRTLAHAPLDEEEAEALGMQQGSASPFPCISASPSGCSPWRVDCWLDADDENPEGCLHLDLFGLSAEVYYYRKRHNEGTTRAYVNGLWSAR